MYMCAAAFGLFALGELALAAGALVGVATRGEGIGGLIGAAAFMALAIGCVAMARAEMRVVEAGVEVRNRGQRLMEWIVLAISEGA